jgi:hypothetical protein
MSGFDDALIAERRNGWWLDRHRQYNQAHEQREAEFAEMITQELAEAAERFRGLPDGLRVLIVRPRKRFERAARIVVDSVTSARYVVVDEYRCWAIPPCGRRGKSGDVVFTEHGGLVWVPGPPIPGYDSGPCRQVFTADDAALVVTAPPPAVDARTEFAADPGYDGGDSRVPVLRMLRNTLAQSFIAYERAIDAGAPIADLFRKWPLEWRHG